MPRPSPRLCAPLLGLLLLAGGLAPRAAARSTADRIDITAVTVEGNSAAQCEARTRRVAAQSRALSLATSPPYDLSDGMRTFYDHVLRLDENGELASTAQLSSVHVTGYDSTGQPVLRSVTPFVRVEVSRPEGTPADQPSRIAISWLWLHRLAEAADPAGRMIQRPSLHRFDLAGEVATAYGAWGHAIAPCRAGADGLWFGAVAVWTYLPP